MMGAFWVASEPTALIGSYGPLADGIDCSHRWDFTLDGKTMLSEH